MIGLAGVRAPHFQSHKRLLQKHITITGMHGQMRTHSDNPIDFYISLCLFVRFHGEVKCTWKLIAMSEGRALIVEEIFSLKQEVWLIKRRIVENEAMRGQGDAIWWCKGRKGTNPWLVLPLLGSKWLSQLSWAILSWAEPLNQLVTKMSLTGLMS